ncbi:hypothetical protein KIN20_007906 [Parelaphostrongylus tenuis]|uniref:Uncharacterized protein n=1 Tax=Parelaphostrongylus tenuis TaxID=148309 RepID=A0AAD5M636_PARTN|nr:hypothetical protein KIN20_007906 [Parelaphostrongylus tenuis]
MDTIYLRTSCLSVSIGYLKKYMNVFDVSTPLSIRYIKFQRLTSFKKHKILPEIWFRGFEVSAQTPRAPPRPSRDRTSSVNYLKGQVARSQPVPTSSFSSTVVEFVHDVTLQHSQTHAVEKVEWIELYSIEKAGQPRQRMDLVVLGLARGFQVWTFNNGGDCEEVMSERQGPIRAFVPLPSNFELRSDEVDT